MIFICFLFLADGVIFAQNNPSLKEEILEGKVVDVLKEDITIQGGQQTLYQKLKILITKGSFLGKEIEIEVGNIPLVGQQKYKIGDEVLVS